MDYGCDFDAVLPCVTFDDDDDANEGHAVMCEAFLQFSLHVRPTNYHRVMCNMAMNVDCKQPKSSTFRPFEIAAN